LRQIGDVFEHMVRNYGVETGIGERDSLQIDLPDVGRGRTQVRQHMFAHAKQRDPARQARLRSEVEQSSATICSTAPLRSM